MVLRGLTKNCGSAALLVAAAFAVHVPARAGDDCTTCWHKCPPPYIHWAEGPPRLWFKCACPRPVCDPCSLEHYGYYQTCWRPWSFTTELNHCLAPKSALEMGVREVLPSTGERQMPMSQGAPGSAAKPR
jgi:hypothetical protein